MTKFQNLIAQLDITRNITDEDIEKISFFTLLPRMFKTMIGAKRG